MKNSIIKKAYSVCSRMAGATALLAVFLPLPSVTGQVFYETGFEPPAYTTGPLAGQQGWTATSIGTVVGTVGDIVPPEGTQMLEVTRPTSSDDRYLSNLFAGFNEGAKEDFLFSFKLAADVKSNAAFGLSIGSSARSSSGAWAGIRSVDTNDFGFYYRNGSTWTRLGTNTVTLEEFYRFDLLVDFDAKTYSIAVYDSSNVLQGSASNIDLYFAGSYTDIAFYNRVYGDMDQIGATKFYVDDILVQIPEASSLALALSVTVLVLLGHRRKFGRKG